MSGGGLSDRLNNRALRSKDFAQRLVQEQGLVAASRFAARLLRERIPEDPSQFGDWQVDVLRALLQVMTSAGDEGLPSLEEAGALETTLTFVGWMPEESRAAMGSLLAIFEAGPLILGPRRERFTRLDPLTQAVYLESWANSPLAPRRAVFRALKSACMMGYWTRPNTWGVIGYGLEGNPGVPQRLKRGRP